MSLQPVAKVLPNGRAILACGHMTPKGKRFNTPLVRCQSCENKAPDYCGHRVVHHRGAAR